MGFLEEYVKTLKECGQTKKAKKIEKEYDLFESREKDFNYYLEEAREKRRNHKYKSRKDILGGINYDKRM
jgi:c-di-AMP phosphodiesterase-like protein